MTATPDNPWGIRFMRMLDMSNDSGLFRTSEQLAAMGAVREGVKWFAEAGTVWVPLYEAKMAHQFDHRWATYEANGVDSRDVELEEKVDPGYAPQPRYWVPEAEVESRLKAKNWNRGWLMGWRDICRSTDERTVIAGVIPRVGVGNKFPLLMPEGIIIPSKVTCLMACLSALVFDYSARQKVGGITLNFFIAEQFPVLPPNCYALSDTAFIVPRVLELTYTTHDLKPFAEDLGYHGPPFPWDPERRASLRAELDAYYARLYGLTRDELRYILDPSEVMGPDYPSETFRVLKDKEMKAFGEYRTARLVLEAWDRFERDGTFANMGKEVEDASYFPVTAWDYAKRDLALALIAQRPGIAGRTHLLAMLLATQPDQMRRHLSKASQSRYEQQISTADRSFVMPSGQSLGWAEVEDHLGMLGAVTISDPAGERRLNPGSAFHETIRTHPESALELAQLALEAVTNFERGLDHGREIPKTNPGMATIVSLLDQEWARRRAA
ncbi:MAG: hypothetical protein HQL56_10665 [Magnetococcales bacterium]|nr:hypothetical protein [Magnetococcales bacterium]